MHPCTLHAVYTSCILLMEVFEWDQAKSERNLRERGFDFEFATRVFDSRHVVWSSARELTERRFVAVGPVTERLFVVVFTYRASDRIRIISARRASAKEVDRYHACIGGKGE